MNETIAQYIEASQREGKNKEDTFQGLFELGFKVEEIMATYAAIEGEDFLGHKVPTAPYAVSKSKGDMVGILVTIGAFLIGVGIFAFIASNWQEMDKAMKMTVILIAMLGSYGLGWSLKEEWDKPKSGEALILLGSIIFGAGIFLVAQIFNIRANWPDGHILWVIGLLAMGFAVGSYPILYLSIPIAFIALFGYPLDILSTLFHGAGNDRFLFTSFILLGLTTVVLFISGYKLQNKIPKDIKSYY